uniref:Zinc finger protein 729 n=1 Tax=Lygus hesperus TaxID=30085 RepID=A0A146L6R4_LYGHE
MLGLPAELLQMESFMKFDQNGVVKEEMNVIACLTVKTNVCDRCQSFYEQNGYLSPTSPCAECMKLAGNVHNEPQKSVCLLCSLEECACETVYQCAYCSESFSSTLLLQKHTFIHCSEVETDVLSVPSDIRRDENEISSMKGQLVQELSRECPFCRMEFEMFDSSKHICSAKYICHLCGGGLSSSYNLRVHLMKHSGDLPHKCDLCSKSFGKPSELTRHLAIHSGIKPQARPGVKSYPCDVCSKAFTRPADLRRHSLTHSGTRPFACTVCGLAFSDTSNLKKHITTHAKGDKSLEANNFSDVKTYHCSYCNKMFSRPSELKRHFTTHTKTRPFSCDFCGLAFSDTSNLRKHVQSHEKMGLRDCMTCHARFDSFEELESHVSRHHNKLKDEAVEHVKCDICGKAFSSEMYLSGHKAGHTESRPYPCSECPKTFKSHSHLKNHMLTHSGAKCQVCAVCGKAFLTKSSLRRHEGIHSRPSERPS